MTAVIIPETNGLSTHSNDLAAPVGSTSVADNVVFSREGRPERRTGFKDYSTNIPDFEPQQLIASAAGDQAYMHLDSGIWYKDTTNWYRKRGSRGSYIGGTMSDVCYLNNHLYVTTTSYVIYDFSLVDGSRQVLAGVFGVLGTADGTGSAARFTSPTGITTNGTDLYVLDNAAIRRVTTAGVVTTVAGLAGTTGTTDGTGNAARFGSSGGLTCDGTDLFVSDTGNHTIRRVAAPLTANAGVVTTVAGSAGATGSTDATGSSARFSSPSGIAFLSGSLFVGDTGNNTVRRVAAPLTAAAGVVTTIAGTAGAGSSWVDGTGAAVRFGLTSQLTTDGTNILLCDRTNHIIRRLKPPLTAGSSVVDTVAGFNSPGSADGNSEARFSFPTGICFDGADLYVLDTSNYTMRKIYYTLSSVYVLTISGNAGVNGATAGTSSIDGIFVGPD